MTVTTAEPRAGGEFQNLTLPRIGPRVGCRNPFRSPSAYVAPAPYGGGRTNTRTPGQVREVPHRQVHRWFGTAIEALPEDTIREDMIAGVFGIRGWTVRARIDSDIEHQPLHGWFLTHPTDGLAVYVDKPRDGDLGPDYVAPRAGVFALARLTWGADLTDLLVQTFSSMRGNAVFPHVRVTKNLGAYAYQTATPAEQQCAVMLVALTGGNVVAFIEHCATAGLPVIPA